MDSVRYVDAALIVVVLALLVALVTVRVRAQRRRTRLADARERFEALIAARLVSDETAPGPDDATPAPEDLDELERGALRDAGVAALIELRGRERERVAALLYEAGVVDAETRALRSGRPDRRRRAADVLGLIASPATHEPLRAALEDQDVRVRLAAARGLAELGQVDDQWSTTLIADAAAYEHRLGAVAELVLALGARAPARLASVYFNSGSSEVRRIVVAVIGELRLGEHVGILREALDGDDELAARAARGLGLVGDLDSTDSLLAVVRDQGRSWFVRAAASTALGQLGDPAAVDALTAELRAGEWPRVRAAAEALARLGAAGEAALRGAGGLETEAGRHAAAALDA
jgi:HEAT repeat protein